MEEKIINGIVYRLVTLRGRSKLVSENGDFLNSYRNQKVTFRYKDGYPCCGGGIPAHLYVAYGWVDSYFEGAEVNHKDFNRENYKASNLEWVTHQGNIQYSVKNNKDVWNQSKQGENNGRSNFTEDEIKKIRKLYDKGMSVADILRLDHPELVHTKDYKSLHSTYLNICKRITWKHID